MTPDDGDDGRKRSDRQAILARRRFFVASAIAGLAATHCDRHCDRPQPCLKVNVVPADASAPPTTTPAAPAASAPDAAPAPQPCLEIAPAPKDASPAVVPPPPPSAARDPEPAPRPCLKIAIPKELDKKR